MFKLMKCTLASNSLLRAAVRTVNTTGGPDHIFTPPG